MRCTVLRDHISPKLVVLRPVNDVVDMLGLNGDENVRLLLGLCTR